MDLRKIKSSLTIGLPHSKIIDNILSLRDFSYQIDYYNVYALAFTNGRDEQIIEYILPLFSFNKQYYYLKYADTDQYEYSNHVFQISNKFFPGTEFGDKTYLKKDSTYSYLFNNLNINIHEFEEMLIEMLNEDLIKYFITNTIIKN